MHEVEVRAIRHVGGPCVPSREVHLVPSGVRHADRAAQAPDHAANESETGDALVLFASLEEQLHPDTQAEERRATLADRADRCVQPEAGELSCAMPEVADTREHHGLCREELVALARDTNIERACPLQCALDVREIAYAVVNDADQGIDGRGASAHGAP